jgi:hypothetical protein
MAYVSSKYGDSFYTEDEELMNQLKNYLNEVQYEK